MVVLRDQRDRISVISYGEVSRHLSYLKFSSSRATHIFVPFHPSWRTTIHTGMPRLSRRVSWPRQENVFASTRQSLHRPPYKYSVRIGKRAEPVHWRLKTFKLCKKKPSTHVCHDVPTRLEAWCTNTQNDAADSARDKQ